MKFPYTGFLSPAPDTGEQVIIFRPEVRIRIFGPAGAVTSMALVDTGADNTILPLSIAYKLQITTEECQGPAASAFGGQQIPMKYADVQLAVDDEQLQLKWHARLLFRTPTLRARNHYCWPSGISRLLQGHVRRRELGAAVGTNRGSARGMNVASNGPANMS